MDFPSEIEWMFSQSNKSPNRQRTSLINENNTVNQTPDRESWILTLSGSTPETPYNIRHSISTQNSSTDKDMKPKLKRGRKSIEKLFPDIVNKTEEIIKEHGFTADSKCRTDTVRSSGVTLKQIKNKLLHEIPLLKDHGLHETTVHRLLSPPNKRFKASTSYKSEVDAKVPPKRNDDR